MRNVELNLQNWRTPWYVGVLARNKVSGHSLLRNETLHGPSTVFTLLVDSCIESFGIPIKDSISIMSRMVCTDNIPSR